MDSASPDRRSTRTRTALVLVAGALVAGTVVGLRATAAPACTAAPEVLVAADPAVAPALGPALGTEQRPDGGGCVRVRVVPRRAADVARDVAAGQGPQLWVADSTASAQLALPARAGAAPTAEIGPSLVSSPLVVVTDPGTAERAGWGQAPPSWRALLGGPVPVSIADPVRTGEGLLALLSAAASTLAVGDPRQPPPPELVANLLRLSRTLLPTTERLADATAPAAVLPEQAAFARHAAGRPTAVAYPAEGGLALDHPVVRVRRPAESPDLARAVGVVEGALRSAEVLAALQRAGFRDPGGALGPDALGSAPVGAAATVAAPPPALPDGAATGLLKLWRTLTTPGQMLMVVDVSGSMAELTAIGVPRSDLARDAVLTALPLFDDRSAVGLWVFSRELGPGGADWRELAPIAPLSGPVADGGTQRELLQRRAAELPSLVGRSTGLYDTALAAVRAVRAAYRPDTINAVALVSDGRNDDVVGIDRATLLEALRAEADPARPVPLFAVGIGPDADLAELTAIAGATGGQGYLARDPAEVQRVFFDAYASWACRGAC